MRAVDGVIRARLRSEVALVNTISEYIISAGGKRLRPALLLLIAAALGYEGSHRHEMAAVIEFIHTATLLHDDVVDESDLRRGRKTANASFGNAAAVLVGDFLYSRAFQMMVEPGNMRIMQVLADATNVIAEGEVLQLMNARDPDTSEEQYLRVIRYKTAQLFEAAARLGAILAQAPQAIEEACATYGRHLGTAFQLVDDLLDYSGATNEIGKNIGDDLREGKPTMPLIYLREHGDESQRSLARHVIETGSIDHIDAVLTALQSSGALDYTRECAQREAEYAAHALELLPASAFKSTLLEFAAFASARTS
ncbi:MAG TPA: polyprenyl synthetase family protein [Burkholderiaceae bacterium]|nr:polyprenyl synthetase family protein [Burkholderiaceae bacterium]